MIEFKGHKLNEDEMIGTGLAAELAGKHRRTILNWCQNGSIPSVRMPGVRGQYEIRVGDLIAAITKPGHEPHENEAVAV